MESETININVKATTVIRPAKDTPNKKLWNSNIDLLVGRIHILTIYFYKSNGSTNFFEPSLLKESLSNVLVSFFPMAGRLGKDADGRVEINCNGEGVLFVEAESDSTVDDFGDFTPSPKLKRLIPAVDCSGEIDSYPLVVIQVTHFKCGGVSLGFGIHHTLSDGLSSLHFINAWSDTARCLSIAVPPFNDRTLLRARTPPSPTFDHIEYHPPPSLNTTAEPQSQLGPKTVSTAILKLTLDQLNTLKSKAKIEGITKDHSTYEALAAHLWRCTCKARGLANDQMSKLHIATDGRARLSPPLPPGYFGNVVFTATPMAGSGELLTEPLALSASRIHTSLTRMDDEYLRSAIDYLELQTDFKDLVRGPDYFASPNLNINSWSRLPVYDADFGWGRPISQGPASILYEGTIYIMPSPTNANDRSVLLAVCLEASHMPLFKQYLYEI